MLMLGISNNATYFPANEASITINHIDFIGNNMQLINELTHSLFYIQNEYV